MSLNGVKSLLDGTVGVGDSVLIEPLNEENFLENLQLRFQHDNIYVSVNKLLFFYIQLYVNSLQIFNILSHCTIS